MLKGNSYHWKLAEWWDESKICCCQCRRFDLQQDNVNSVVRTDFERYPAMMTFVERFWNLEIRLWPFQLLWFIRTLSLVDISHYSNIQLQACAFWAIVFSHSQSHMLRALLDPNFRIYIDVNNVRVSLFGFSRRLDRGISVKLVGPFFFQLQLPSITCFLYVYWCFAPWHLCRCFTVLSLLALMFFIFWKCAFLIFWPPYVCIRVAIIFIPFFAASFL